MTDPNIEEINKRLLKFEDPNYKPEPEDLSLPVCFPELPVLPLFIMQEFLKDKFENQKVFTYSFLQGSFQLINGMKILEKYGIHTFVSDMNAKIKEKVSNLKEIYPDISEERLLSVLSECGGDVEKAAAKLFN